MRRRARLPRGRPGPRACIAALALSAAGAVFAPASAQGNATHVLILSGLGGEPSYAAEMHTWAATLYDAMRERFAVPAANIAWLAESKETDPARVSGRAGKEEIQAAIEAIAKRAGPGDVVLVTLFGHGSYQSGESRFSMPGPDLTAADFAVLLGRLGARKVVFVNTTSASGGFVEALSAANRIVVTATRSGNERNAARFGGHFVDALANDVADTDKDGAVSVLEAFTYARLQTERLYESERKLPTEHAVLDDNADGKGTSEPDPAAGEGALARATFLGQAAVVAGAAAPENASPELRKLYDERRAIEQRLDALRARKDTMDPVQYEKQLEDLLVELALKNQEIRRMEGGG